MTKGTQLTPLEYAAAFKRYWWVIALATALGFAVGTMQAPAPEYSATARVAVLPTPAQAADANERYLASVRANQANSVAVARMPLYVSLLEDPGVASAASSGAAPLTSAELAERVTVSQIESSVSMLVKATGPDAAGTTALAGDVAESLAEVISDVERERRGETLLRGAVIGETTPAAAVNSSRSFHPWIGAAVGLALGLGLAVLLARLDPMARDRRSREEVLGAPVLGEVAARKGRGRRTASTGPDAVDELRTNLFFLRPPEARALTVALSRAPKLSGTDQLALALADSLADTGARVLVASTEGHETGSETSGHDNVDVIDAGYPDDELHGSGFASLMAGWAEDYDFVLVQTGPMEGGSGALAVGARSDLSVLVTPRRGTRKDDLRSARTNLERVGGTVAGSVVIT